MIIGKRIAFEALIGTHYVRVEGIVLDKYLSWTRVKHTTSIVAINFYLVQDENKRLYKVSCDEVIDVLN